MSRVLFSYLSATNADAHQRFLNLAPNPKGLFPVPDRFGLEGRGKDS